MSYHLQKPIDRGDSLTPAKFKGKDRARKALLMAEDEQKALLAEIITNCKTGINVLQRIRHAAEFEQRSGRFHGWNGLGEEQGNAGRGIDAAVGRIFQNTQYIKLLHDVLEIPIEERTKNERRVEEGQVPEADGQPSEGRQAEGKEEVHAQEPEDGRAGHPGRGSDVRKRQGRASGSAGNSRDAATDAQGDPEDDGGKPVEGSKARSRTRKRGTK